MRLAYGILESRKPFDSEQDIGCGGPRRRGAC